MAKSNGKPKQASTTHGPPRGVRPFWSGTISFGLVNVPVKLYPANRGGPSGLRMLDTDGAPLSRRYYCPAEDVEVHPEHIQRGYELDNGQYVIVRDEELESLQPRKSREIDLRRFVKLDDVSPMFFERAYFLVPDGESTKAYLLLAAVLQHTQRAGIATFVMRAKEYLVAILAENGILRAATLRFEEELRTPEDVGLPEQTNPNKRQAAAFEKAIKRLAKPSLAEEELQDGYSRQLEALVAKKAKRKKNVVDVKQDAPVEDADDATTIDLLETIRRSLQTENGAPGDGRLGSKKRQSSPKEELQSKTKDELYKQAAQLDISGRSNMNKRQLVQALKRV